jgi:protoporphyrinogen oxidase
MGAIFFKSYSEKLWGLKCNEIHSDFAKQRIKKLTLYEAVKSAVFKKNTKNHKTLVDEFAYPKEGTGMFYEKIKKEILKNGGNIYLNNKITKIKRNKQLIIKDQNNHTRKYNYMISTMPLNYLLENISAPKNILKVSKTLKFRNTVLVYLLLSGKNPFPDQWIYVHSNKLKTGRITNFKNWVSSINGDKTETIICLEYWCYEDDEIWTATDKNLIALATEEIYQTTLVARNCVKDGSIVRLPKCYPVYASDYKEHLKPIEKFLSHQQGISVIGRYGAFKYNNQDHSILMGILAAENFLLDANHNLWEMNTDYEYQELSKITETGLLVKE